MTEFLRITKETLTKATIVEISKLLEREEAMQELRDSWHK